MTLHRIHLIASSAAAILDPVDPIPGPGTPIPEPVEGSGRGSWRALRGDRGAVTAEMAMLIAVVIMFGWLGIRFVGDPMRDPVFRVVYGILMRIYELIVTMVGGFR
jgi:hypothetical protein